MLSIERIVRVLRGVWRFMTGERDAAGEVIARVFEDNFDGLVVVGEDGRIVAASKVASNILLGATGGSLAGKMAAQAIPRPMSDAVQRAFADGRRGVPTPMALARIGDPNHGGYLVQYVVTLSELSSRSGPLPRRVVNLTFWDETERRRREEELAFLGTHDQLTGALIRTELVKIIGTALDGERQRDLGLTMLVLDLQRFKSVNETLGHAFGDLLLKQVVSRLKGAGIETVTRLGGDTFAMIRPGRMTADEAQHFCQGLIDRLTLPYSLREHRAVVGVRVGITHTDISGYDPDVLLSHADIALEAAKRRPGNSWERFTREMDQRLKQRQGIDIALRQALSQDQFAIIYQPQCSHETGQLVGVEALLRWTHPVLGVVPPELFMPVAEENGEMVEIGRWMLKAACREVASWPFQTRLAVNVSPVQFELVDLVAEVREALNLSGLPPHRLDLEITEGLFTAPSDEIVHTLQRLRQLGVGIALDDFGTGYSSIGHMGRLPVDKIKIDRSFVANLTTDREAGAIIRAVMTLSETLDKVVIAQGVETTDQAWMLRMAGCRIGQGYHFGRPRRGGEMATWFDSQPTPRRQTAR